jgi:hypothetical protein
MDPHDLILSISILFSPSIVRNIGVVIMAGHVIGHGTSGDAMSAGHAE